MNNDDTSSAAQDRPTPRWSPLSPLERRIVGVLVEKAKTTPDAYPLTLNALRTGCNQKSNRDPLMQVEEDDLADALEALREKGALAEVLTGGRTAKYRHYMYDWLGVDKTEMAVMAELLLRGAQTEGELRGRAARMEPIADLAALRPVLASLKAKGLVIPLTPEGRGHVVTHALYSPAELASIRAHSGAGDAIAPTPPPPEPPEPPSAHSASPPAAAFLPSPGPAMPAAVSAECSALRQELAEVKSQLAELRSEFEDAAQRLQLDVDDLKRFKDELA